MEHVKFVAVTIFISFSVNSIPQDSEYHLSTRIGLGTAPLYLGSSKYAEPAYKPRGRSSC